MKETIPLNITDKIFAEKPAGVPDSRAVNLHGNVSLAPEPESVCFFNEMLFDLDSVSRPLHARYVSDVRSAN